MDLTNQSAPLTSRISSNKAAQLKSLSSILITHNSDHHSCFTEHSLRPRVLTHSSQADVAVTSRAEQKLDDDTHIIDIMLQRSRWHQQWNAVAWLSCLLQCIVTLRKPSAEKGPREYKRHSILQDRSSLSEQSSPIQNPTSVTHPNEGIDSFLFYPSSNHYLVLQQQCSSL